MSHSDIFVRAIIVWFVGVNLLAIFMTIWSIKIFKEARTKMLSQGKSLSLFEYMYSKKSNKDLRLLAPDEYRKEQRLKYIWLGFGAISMFLMVLVLLLQDALR